MLTFEWIESEMTCRFSIPAFKYINLIKHHKLFNFGTYSKLNSKLIIMQSFLNGNLEDKNATAHGSFEGTTKQLEFIEEGEFDADESLITCTSFKQSYTSFSLCNE